MTQQMADDSRLELCKRNYAMLNMILDKRWPWHVEIYDFSTININRYLIKARDLNGEAKN